METTAQEADVGEEKRDSRRGGRLKGVRRRKRARQVFACEVMAWKMKLVKKRSEENEK
jgi:hypothetical protein